MTKVDIEAEDADLEDYSVIPEATPEEIEKRFDEFCKVRGDLQKTRIMTGEVSEELLDRLLEKQAGRLDYPKREGKAIRFEGDKQAGRFTVLSKQEALAKQAKHLKEKKQYEIMAEAAQRAELPCPYDTPFCAVTAALEARTPPNEFIVIHWQKWAYT